MANSNPDTSGSLSYDIMEVIIRILKYLFEGLVVATAAYIMPGRKLNFEEILTLGLVAGATFSILDLFAPSIGITMRQGAGFGMGLNLVGGVSTNGMPNRR